MDADTSTNDCVLVPLESSLSDAIGDGAKKDQAKQELESSSSTVLTAVSCRLRPTPMTHKEVTNP
jgi:hypothetical protein